MPVGWRSNIKIMSKKSALYTMFSILGVVLIFHFLIFFEVIAYDKVWAGRLKSFEEMRKFETFSILLNLSNMGVLFIKYRLLNKGTTNKIIDIIIWCFVVLFALNTLGNLFAQNIYELIFGTLLTMVSAILCYIIVRKEKKIST